MICKNCGFDNEKGNFCANCGADLRNGDAYTDYAPMGEAPFNVPANPVISTLNYGGKNGLFLTICILLSVSCVAYIFQGTTPPLMPILYTIFLWLMFGAACKEKITPQHIRNFCGALKAEYIIGFILAGLLAFMGVLFAILLIALGEDPLVFGEFIAEFETLVPEVDASMLTVDAMPMLAVIVFVAFILIGVGALLINLLIVRPIKDFAKSLHTSAEQGLFLFEKAGKTATVLMVYGIICAVSALGTLGAGEIAAFVSEAAEAAAVIIGSVWVRNFLVPYDVGAVYYAPQETQE